MKRMFGALLVGLLAGSAAQGHFPFIVPEGDGASAKVVFSDSLDPDKNVNIEKLADTKLTLRDAGGKDTPLEWTKGDGFYAVKIPGTGPRTVFGVTDYGVLQKGDAKPFRLVYYPKAVVGGEAKAVGGALKLEVAAVAAGGKTKFQVLAEGKPAADLEVTVMLPGTKAEKKAVKTDKDGFTPEFAETGRFGVYARWTEAKGGEHAGKKYDEVRHYATLVADAK